ncbi:MAG: oligosaccharide flippase family protein [Oscillospiraceae bacterium]
MKNRYDKLLGNTLIFAIGSFSSKAMVFLLMPLYSRVLTDAQYGATDVITTTANLLMPFVMLSINEAIIRFCMDRSVKKSEVFSIGLVTVLAGFAVFGLLAPLMLQIKMLSAYTLLIYLYVLAGMLKNITAQFVRSSGLVRLFAFDGFLATLTTILFNVTFLLGFKWGVTGYILSIILSNVVSILFLFFTARLWRYVKLTAINKKLWREMLRYAVPLIPTTMFWWITTASDRYFIIYFWGEAANGLYAAAHKLPALLTMVSAVFYQAWQISAVSESGQGARTSRFYSQVYDYYSTLLLLAASGVIFICRPLISVWLAESYYEAWRFVPFLTMAEVFSSLVTFMGSFYMVAKRNATVPIAIAVGAIANIGLNYLMVPTHGALGAAMATVASYLLAFLVRAVDIRRLVDIKLRPLPLACSLLLLMAQTALLFREGDPHPILTQLLMVLLMVLLNLRPVMRLCLAMLERLRQLRHARG